MTLGRAPLASYIPRPYGGLPDLDCSCKGTATGLVAQLYLSEADLSAHAEQIPLREIGVIFLTTERHSHASELNTEVALVFLYFNFFDRSMGFNHGDRRSSADRREEL
jgi:hypothetical protein